MSIWINRNSIDRKTAESIYKDCVINEEINDYDIKLGKVPLKLLMFKKDPTGQFFIVPYRVATKYGYKQNNTNWKQIINVVEDSDGNKKFVPEFTGTFRDYQTEIIPEIIECLQKNNTVIIGLPPGWGKTIIAAYLIWMIGLMAVCITKQLKVNQGWVKTFQKVLPGMIVWNVGESARPEKFDIILCMNERTHLIPEYIKNQVGVLIVDEVHTVSTFTQMDTFLGFRPKYVIFESATFKAGSMWRMAAAVAGEDGVFRISKVPYNFYVVKTGVEGEKEFTKKGGLIPSSIQKSLIENKRRKQIVQALIYNHITYRKFICLQRVTADIDENITRFNNLGITCDTLWGSKKEYSQSLVLFGTYGKISTGFDEENACDDYWTLPVKSDTMIFINSVLSPHILIQSMGRCMRTLDEVPAFIFLLDDNSNVKNHLNSNKWLIELTNGRIINADYKTGFIPMNPKFGHKFSHTYTPGFYFKVLLNEEYERLTNDGFYGGNADEIKAGYVILQTNAVVMEYKKLISPNAPCFLLTLQYCNLYMLDEKTVREMQGFIFLKNSIFFKNIVSVTILH